MKKILIMCFIFVAIFSLVGCGNEKQSEPLSKETAIYIKQCYINYQKSKNSSYSENIDDVIIKHYYGDFDGIKVAVIKGDISGNQIDIPDPFVYYVCLVGKTPYKIRFLPEIISVYYENNYYTLKEACLKGIITKKILDKLDCYY